MGYEAAIQFDVLKLLDYFQDQVTDKEVHKQVRDLIADRGEWTRAKDMFSHVRNKLLANERVTQPDDSVQSHYLFLEVCLKTFFNETQTEVPFDSCSSYFVIKNALWLSKELNISLESVTDVLLTPVDTSKGGATMSSR